MEQETVAKKELRFQLTMQQFAHYFFFSHAASLTHSFPAPSSHYICQDRVLDLEDQNLDLLIVFFLSHFADAVLFKGQ